MLSHSNLTNICLTLYVVGSEYEGFPQVDFMLSNCTHFPCPWLTASFGYSETNHWQVPFTPQGKTTYSSKFTCTDPSRYVVNLADGFATEWCTYVNPPCPMSAGNQYQYIAGFDPHDKIYTDFSAEFRRVLKETGYWDCEWGFYTDSAYDETGKPFYCFNLTSHLTSLGDDKPYGLTLFDHHQQEPQEVIVERHQERMKTLSKVYNTQPELSLLPTSKYAVPESDVEYKKELVQLRKRRTDEL